MRKFLRTGLVSERAWRGQAVGIGPHRKAQVEETKMAAAAGKKESVSLSLSHGSD